MRLLYLIDSLSGGGAESVLVNLIHYLSQSEPEIDCHVATLYPTSEKYLTGKDFPVHCLDMPSKYALTGVSRLRRLLSSGHFDLVHAHLFPANYLAALTSLQHSDIPWLYTEHSMWNRRRRFLALRPVEHIIYSRFRRIIAVSQVVADSLTRWLPSVHSKIRVIPNGVALSQLPHAHRDWSPGHGATLLFAGRLEHVKGVDVLLKAFSLLPPPITLWVAGTGSRRALFERLASDLRVSERVQFLGFRSDVQQLMLEADCLVLPSRWEGLPMVMLEAMAVGTPVVATAVGGIPEVIENGVTGWLAPPEDPIALAQVLSEALENGEKRQQICESARARIMDSYSIEVTARKTLALYTELLSDSDG